MVVVIVFICWMGWLFRGSEIDMAVMREIQGMRFRRNPI